MKKGICEVRDHCGGEWQERMVYVCAVCGKRKISAVRTGHGPGESSHTPGNVFSGYEVSGGKLLTTRPKIPWTHDRSEAAQRFSKNSPVVRVAQRGGVCDRCLTRKSVRNLAPNIEFETFETFKSR